MNWVLLSFSVITPMSTSIGLAFKRREKALAQLCIFKTTLLAIYSAHIYWDWDKVKYSTVSTAEMKNDDDDQAVDDDRQQQTSTNTTATTNTVTTTTVGGRITQSQKINWEEYSNEVLNVILKLCIDITRMLTLPYSTRARHRVTKYGKKEAKTIDKISFNLYRNIHVHLVNLGLFCEKLKCHGLLPNEATRIRQWERDITEQIGKFFLNNSIFNQRGIRLYEYILL